jgi:hypothetical protein
MSTLSGNEQAVITVQRVLAKPEDWHDWLDAIQNQAVRLRIWEYIDPSKTEDKIMKNVALNVLASFEEDKFTKREYSLYKTALAKFERLNQLLQSFYGAVIKTLNYEETKDIVRTCLMPRELLVKLKERLCPTAARFYAQLRKRYYALRDSDLKLQNREVWICEWRVSARDIITASIFVVDICKNEFIAANSRLDCPLTLIIKSEYL